ncbi:Short-chain dehydrogenase/reductase SDR [Candidatus Zixiibacteriota bacterium]|nr:Short-chain dehydrogenase/reductase SDR [candidate division Zixibacteria bacterium]
MEERALITGASGGFGLELAKIFARNHIDLFLVARSGEKLADLKKSLHAEYGVDVSILVRDISDRSAPEEIFEQVKADALQVDCLVNNAGFGDFSPFQESDWNKLESMIDLNIKSLTHLTRLFLPPMIERKKGRIMNIASTAAFQPGPFWAVYFATKAYVLHFSEAIANELNGTGVTVTALCPGPSASGFADTAAGGQSGLFKRKNLPSAADVAEYGYWAMMKGKRVAIHGNFNRVLAFTIRFAPRNMVTSIVRQMTKQR